jgi:hypothetical protein
MISEKILEYFEKDFPGYSPERIPISYNISLILTNWEETKTVLIEAKGPIKPQKLKEKAEYFAKEILGKKLKQDKKVSSFYKAEKQIEKAKVSVNYFKPVNLDKNSVGERVYIKIDVEKNGISNELREMIKSLDSIPNSFKLG